jgi:DNA polymerase III delta prime subunit
MSVWINFKNNFNNIISNFPEYNLILNSYSKYEYNLLFYSCIGFPIDLLIDEFLKVKFNNNINKKELIWNKNIIYYENQNFFEIDLNNPNISNDYSFLTEMLLFIIKNKSVSNKKHLIILKNIDKLNEYSYIFRIILEKYYNNVYFICSTNKICKIESPIKSRFSLIRLRLFTIDEIKIIFNNYIKENLLIENRNIIFCIFLAQVNINEPLLITNDFCNFNYPPIQAFVNSKFDIYDIRQLSYKLSQYNLSIFNITMDLIKIYKKKSVEIIKAAAEIDYLLTISNKGREPIYIENFLCQVLL